MTVRTLPGDVLYIPRGAAYRLGQTDRASRLIVCRAPADNPHPPFHARWDEFSRDERRIRHLRGKDVFLMFDVSEGADKLIAGFTIFQPFQRSWPPHNHTDQEEIYIFTQGRGSMEVYAEEEGDKAAEKGKATLVIAKQRNGPTGDVNLTFIKSYTRFESAAKVSDEDLPS